MFHVKTFLSDRGQNPYKTSGRDGSRSRAEDWCFWQGRIEDGGIGARKVAFPVPMQPRTQHCALLEMRKEF
jgi:hypothetical protein